MVALNGGGHQICPSYDQFHRGIIICDRIKFDQRPTHRKNQVKKCRKFFFFFNLLQNNSL